MTVNALHCVETDKSVARAADDLAAAVQRHGFGVLHVYDLKKTLASKGVDVPHECRILDVCNPQQAGRVLSADMNLSTVLPCRIAVYDHGGRTWIGMVRPTYLVAQVADGAHLESVAAEVELTIIAIMNDAAELPAQPQ